MVQDCRGLRCIGLHSHIGSQIFDSDGFVTAIDRLTDLYQRGLAIGLPLSILNVGGGFGIAYTGSDAPLTVPQHIEHIAMAVSRGFHERDMMLPEVWIEPGRSVVGPAGVTLYSVGTQKKIANVRNYLAIDGGMTDNPRLALYGATYRAVLANRVEDAAVDTWSIAGKCCESGDMVIWDAQLPNPQFGDILAVFATGAYNYSMASHYNRIPKPAVVFVHSGIATVVVERETWADLARMDRPLSSRL